MTFLRGFENLLIDLYESPQTVKKLADVVFTFEEEVLSTLPKYGFHGVAFYDDWGTQNGLIISPELWREFFKPRYQHQFEIAHRLGLEVYFHSCGAIHDIIPDLIEIGVDMLNLSQPNLFDLEEIGRLYGGKTCFVCPVSYQTTSISGTPEDIFRDAKNLIKHLGSQQGGFIGYIEDYHSMGMSEENYQACIEAFRTLGNQNRL